MTAHLSSCENENENSFQLEHSLEPQQTVAAVPKRAASRATRASEPPSTHPTEYRRLAVRPSYREPGPDSDIDSSDKPDAVDKSNPTIHRRLAARSHAIQSQLSPQNISRHSTRSSLLQPAPQVARINDVSAKKPPTTPRRPSTRSSRVSDALALEKTTIATRSSLVGEASPPKQVVQTSSRAPLSPKKPSPTVACDDGVGDAIDSDIPNISTRNTTGDMAPRRLFQERDQGQSPTPSLADSISRATEIDCTMQNLNRWRKAELVDECRRRGLPVSGLKAELRERISEHYRTGGIGREEHSEAPPSQRPTTRRRRVRHSEVGYALTASTPAPRSSRRRASAAVVVTENDAVVDVFGSQKHNQDRDARKLKDGSQSQEKIEAGDIDSAHHHFSDSESSEQKPKAQVVLPASKTRYALRSADKRIRHGSNFSFHAQEEKPDSVPLLPENDVEGLSDSGKKETQEFKRIPEGKVEFAIEQRQNAAPSPPLYPSRTIDASMESGAGERNEGEADPSPVNDIPIVNELDDQTLNADAKDTERHKSVLEAKQVQATGDDVPSEICNSSSHGHNEAKVETCNDGVAEQDREGGPPDTKDGDREEPAYQENVHVRFTTNEDPIIVADGGAPSLKEGPKEIIPADAEMNSPSDDVPKAGLRFVEVLDEKQWEGKPTEHLARKDGEEGNADLANDSGVGKEESESDLEKVHMQDIARECTAGGDINKTVALSHPAIEDGGEATESVFDFQTQVTVAMATEEAERETRNEPVGIAMTSRSSIDDLHLAESGIGELPPDVIAVASRDHAQLLDDGLKDGTSPNLEKDDTSRGLEETECPLNARLARPGGSRDTEMVDAAVENTAIAITTEVMKTSARSNEEANPESLNRAEVTREQEQSEGAAAIKTDTQDFDAEVDGDRKTGEIDEKCVPAKMDNDAPACSDTAKASNSIDDETNKGAADPVREGESLVPAAVGEGQSVGAARSSPLTHGSKEEAMHKEGTKLQHVDTSNSAKHSPVPTTARNIESNEDLPPESSRLAQARPDPFEPNKPSQDAVVLNLAERKLARFVPSSSEKVVSVAPRDDIEGGRTMNLEESVGFGEGGMKQNRRVEIGQQTAKDDGRQGSSLLPAADDVMKNCDSFSESPLPSPRPFVNMTPDKKVITDAPGIVVDRLRNKEKISRSIVVDDGMQTEAVAVEQSHEGASQSPSVALSRRQPEVPANVVLQDETHAGVVESPDALRNLPKVSVKQENRGDAGSASRGSSATPSASQNRIVGMDDQRSADSGTGSSLSDGNEMVESGQASWGSEESRDGDPINELTSEAVELIDLPSPGESKSSDSDLSHDVNERDRRSPRGSSSSPEQISKSPHSDLQTSSEGNSMDHASTPPSHAEIVIVPSEESNSSSSDESGSKQDEGSQYSSSVESSEGENLDAGERLEEDSDEAKEPAIGAVIGPDVDEETSSQAGTVGEGRTVQVRIGPPVDSQRRPPGLFIQPDPSAVRSIPTTKESPRNLLHAGVADDAGHVFSRNQISRVEGTHVNYPGSDKNPHSHTNIPQGSRRTRDEEPQRQGETAAASVGTHLASSNPRKSSFAPPGLQSLEPGIQVFRESLTPEVGSAPRATSQTSAPLVELLAPPPSPAPSGFVAAKRQAQVMRRLPISVERRSALAQERRPVNPSETNGNRAEYKVVVAEKDTVEKGCQRDDAQAIDFAKPAIKSRQELESRNKKRTAPFDIDVAEPKEKRSRTSPPLMPIFSMPTVSSTLNAVKVVFGSKNISKDGWKDRVHKSKEERCSILERLNEIEKKGIPGTTAHYKGINPTRPKSYASSFPPSPGDFVANRSSLQEGRNGSLFTMGSVSASRKSTLDPRLRPASLKSSAFWDKTRLAEETARRVRELAKTAKSVQKEPSPFEKMNFTPQKAPMPRPSVEQAKRVSFEGEAVGSRPKKRRR